MCLGCLQRCPKAAIQYGNGAATGKHGQYRNPHVTVYKQLFLPHSGNKKTSARRCGSTCFITGADNGSHTMPKNGFMIAFQNSLGQFFGQTWLSGHLSRRVSRRHLTAHNR